MPHARTHARTHAHTHTETGFAWLMLCINISIIPLFQIFHSKTAFHFSWKLCLGLSFKISIPREMGAFCLSLSLKVLFQMFIQLARSMINDQQIFITSHRETISRSSWAPIIVVEARIKPCTFQPLSPTLLQLSYPARRLKATWEFLSKTLWPWPLTAWWPWPLSECDDVAH
jgi:hypothetical protein